LKKPSQPPFLRKNDFILVGKKKSALLALFQSSVKMDETKKGRDFPLPTRSIPK